MPQSRECFKFNPVRSSRATVPWTRAFGAGATSNGIAASLVAILVLPNLVFGEVSSLEDLRLEIQAKNEELEKLEEEAQKYREEVAEQQERGRTLKAELARIERTIGQLQRDVAVTEKRLKQTGLQIEELKLEIRENERSVEKLRLGLAGLVQALAERGRESMLAILLKNELLSNFFRQIDYFKTFEQKILDSLDSLRALSKELEEKKASAESKKKIEEDLRRILKGRQNALFSEKRERDTLLSATRNEEKRYQTLLNGQEAKIAALADEIREIEGKIRITIDPASLPAKGSGVLAYPLGHVTLRQCLNLKELVNCVTQFFGYTSFAAVGGYGGRGHNGIDFRAPVGTEVSAAEDGIIEGVGDTDIGCRRASYGKWILIRHKNNLSTLYAHLVAVEVSTGEEVQRGERIGLSGKSGYATGPHLHFTVFASQAVKIESIRSRVCGRSMTLPIAAINGYLNPLDYL